MAFKGKAATLGANLYQNSVDAGVMAGQVRDLKTQLNELTVRVTGFDRIGELVALLIGGIVLAALLTRVGRGGRRVLRVGRLEAAPDRGRRRGVSRRLRPRGRLRSTQH